MIIIKSYDDNEITEALTELQAIGHTITNRILKWSPPQIPIQTKTSRRVCLF
jgi:hypothetical protein